MHCMLQLLGHLVELAYLQEALSSILAFCLFLQYMWQWHVAHANIFVSRALL